MGRKSVTNFDFDKELEELGLEEAKRKIKNLKTQLIAQTEISSLLRQRCRMLKELVILYEDKFGCITHTSIKDILSDSAEGDTGVAHDESAEG